jgi:hypothetical protein
MIQINSKADLNRAVANALHPEPPASERRAIHESGVWRWARYHTPVTRNEWARWEPADFCGDPCASNLLRNRMWERGWDWALASDGNRWHVEMYAQDHCCEVAETHTTLETAMALAALRALGVEFELAEGWDARFMLTATPALISEAVLRATCQP